MVINWSIYARACLKEIHEYLSDKSHSLASKVIDELIESVEILKTFPNAGYRELDSEEQHVRTLLQGHYRIAYHIIDDNRIDIIGVYHAASNYKWKIRRSL